MSEFNKLKGMPNFYDIFLERGHESRIIRSKQREIKNISNLNANYKKKNDCLYNFSKQ